MRDIEWAALAVEELWTQTTLPSVQDGLAAADYVINQHALPYVDGRAFCLALVSQYVDRQDAWGTVEKPHARLYSQRRKQKTILPDMEDFYIAQEIPAFPLADARRLLRRAAAERHLPKVEAITQMRRTLHLVFDLVGDRQQRALQFELVVNLYNEPRVTGFIQAADDGKLVFHTTAEWLLGRIRWQICRMGEIALEEHVLAAIQEPLAVFEVLHRHFLQAAPDR